MKEQEIRPNDLVSKYRELCAHDAEVFFHDCKRRKIACIACDSIDHTPQFTKNKFTYSLCKNCGSLFQSPRPTLDIFENFYRFSESSKYWAEVFFPAVAEHRRKKIIKPRVKGLAKLCMKKNINVNKIIDIGAGFGIFLEEWLKLYPNTNAVAVEPLPSMAEECRHKGLNVVQAIAEKMKGYKNFADLVVCFEVLEHVDDPIKFIKNLSKMVRPGGYLFVSTLCIDGFDLKTLWDKSSQISPPHHINFFSINGFEILFKRTGFIEIEISTPGQLDVDIVKNAAESDNSILDNNNFLKHVLNDNILMSEFQKFLSKNKLSSHAWIIGKKK